MMLRSAFIAALIIIIIAVIAFSQVPLNEGKFVVKIHQWNGLMSDEYMNLSASDAADMTNWEIVNESGRSFIQQRRGFFEIDTMSETVTSGEYRGVYVSQIPGDSERIFVAMSDGNLYQKSAFSKYLDLNVDGNTADFCNAFQFKDTIIFTGDGRVWKIARNAGGSPGIRVVNNDNGNDTTVYGRLFLHQERVYGYGVGVDSTDSKLVWWPEFWIHSFDALPDTTTGGGYIYIARDDGDFATNAMSQQGHVMFYKSHSIYKVMISPSTNTPVEVIKMAGGIGAYGYDCVSEWNGRHYFIASNGVYENDGVNIVRISDPINYWFTDSITVTTGRSKLFKTAVVDNKLYVSLPIRNASNTPTAPGDLRVLVYDLDLKVWYKYDFTGDQASRTDTVPYLLHYEYSPRCVSPLTGTVRYGQKLLFTMDSIDSINRTKLCMFPEGWKDRGRDSIYATWDGAFFPFGDMYQRSQLERVLIWARAGTLDTLGFDFYSDLQPASVPNSAIDTALIPIPASFQTGDMSNTRISAKMQGSVIRYRIRSYGGAPKINWLELVLQPKGPAQP